MEISVCASIHDALSARINVPLPEYLGGSEALSKEACRLWSPCLFSDNTRKQASATEVTCLAYDFDNGVDSELEGKLELLNVKRIWHDTATKGNRRLILFLDKPVPATKWRVFYQNITRMLEITKADPACANVGRFYYLPLKGVHVEAAGDYLIEVDELLGPVQESEDLSVLRKALLRASNVEMLSLIRLGLAGKPIAQAGGRDVTVNKLAFYLGKHVAPKGTTPEAVCAILSVAMPGPEPKTHWEHKFKLGFDRGMAERTQAQEDRKAITGSVEGLQQRTDINGNTVIISNSYNANLILKQEGTFRFRKNVVEDTVECATDSEFKTLQDHEVTNMTNWLQSKYHIQLSTAQVYEQCLAIAHGLEWDPIKEYLKELVWDGVHRIDRFLCDYMGCAETPEARLYSRKWLVMLAARAFKPGCKADDVLVVQGAQGLGKSTALRLLTEPWFSDSKVVVGDKDSYMAASRSWVHEFGELASLKRSDRDTIKAFFTSVNDTYRPPYGRVTVSKPRRTVFVATTNESEFLDDETGDRRYWVVTATNQINFLAITRDRNQLLAEAVQAFRAGESWWLSTDAEKRIQREANAPHRGFQLTTKTEAIKIWWDQTPANKRPVSITTAQVLREIWNVPLDRASRNLEIEAGRCLRHLGFKSVRKKDGNVYEPPSSWNNINKTTEQLMA